MHRVPSHWKQINTFLAFAVLLAALASVSIPPLMSVIAVALAMAIVQFSPSLLALGRTDGRAGRRETLKLIAITSAPIGLSSLGLSYWMMRGGLEYHWGLAALISLTTIAAVLLGNRVSANLSAKATCWVVFAILDGSMLAIGSATAGLLVCVLLARHQFTRRKEETARKLTLERVQHRAEDIMRDYEDTGQGWFWETDRRGQITYLSPSVGRLLGRDQDQSSGRPFVELFDLTNDNREGERTLNFHLSARSAFTELAVRANCASEERWWSINGRPIFDEFQNFCGFRGSGTDLTEKRKSDEQATRLARFDSLTGLANRFQMSQSLEKVLNAPLEMHRECGVMLLDLDRFKNVNDTLGHPAGDALLKQVAQRLAKAVGKCGQVGRRGGDEFEVIVPGRVDRQALAALGNDIIAALSQSYTIEGNRVVIGASVGIAVAPDDGQASDELIRNADLALYAAKDAGRGRLHFFAADLHAKAEEKNRLEQDLRDAIAFGGLALHYQPVIHTATERIAGFEALLRWQHPVTGWMSPAKFIPVAEEAGLIGAIGEWAIKAACRDLARWPTDVRCAVNVSPLQFANPNLPTIVREALEEAGVEPSRLELEITESVFLSDDEGTDAMFSALKEVGVRLALDDFGTGYSSLGYLKKAPFDKIKIDQSFVRGATEAGSRNGAIISSITSLAQALGMDTTAEGVETLDELDLVRAYGCSHIQGYIYEKPLDGATATARLASGLAAIARGPHSARGPRQTVLRKVLLEHSGQHYNGTIRNMSATGALVEGLWNVPVGTIFRISLSEMLKITATTRWCTENRLGVEFACPLARELVTSSTGATFDNWLPDQADLRRTA
ncbi:EAL domain-containing protein [Tsuneonella sp. HG094]